MVTERIAIGTAGIVLPLREPKILAKQATSIDQLSGGRLLMGLSSGDRAAEYPLYGVDYDSRGDRFRDAFDVFQQVAEADFPTFESPRFGRSGGTHDLVPKPRHGVLPTIAIGRAQQTETWLARHMDGLIVPAPPEDGLEALTAEWRVQVAGTCGEGVSKPLGIAGFLDLADNPAAPLERIRGGIRSGIDGLAAFLRRAADAGVAHVALNPKISRRPYADVMEELAEALVRPASKASLESAVQ
ncbi:MULTISPECIES: LLM class flavin-dependent oxidoreductase [unclassified Variovorax]|nr:MULTISPECIES: LLM class flavin-dependent oxidoreductase [unclassified Variovorax]